MESESNSYWSNCVVEGVKAYLADPFYIDIEVKWAPLQWPIESICHIYWLDRRVGRYYHFSSEDKDLSIFRQIWFKGNVKRYLNLRR